MSGPAQPAPDGSFQRLIEQIYFERDQQRGIPRTRIHSRSRMC